MIITAFNPSTDQLEKSYLSNAISAGVTAISVKNNDRFAINDRIMIGEMGREKTEVVTVSAVNTNGTGLTIGATTFSHDADEPVTRLRYDQVKFYRSTSGISGTYSLLTTVALDVDNAELITVYDDTVGLSTYYYKVSYYGSVSTLESSQSDPVPGQGYARNTVGALIDEFLREVADETEIITDRTELIAWMNECSDFLQTNAARPYSFLKSRTTLTRTAARNYIDWPTDSSSNQIMWKFDHLDHNIIDSTVSPTVNKTYTLRVIPLEEWRNRFEDNTIDTTTEDDETKYVALDDAMKRFRFWPPFKTTQTSAFYLYYWKYFTTIDSEGDVFETPTPRPYKLYLLHKFFQKKAYRDSSLQSVADRRFADFKAEVTQLDKHNRKDTGSPRSFGFLPGTNKGWRGF